MGSVYLLPTSLIKINKSRERADAVMERGMSHSIKKEGADSWWFWGGYSDMERIVLLVLPVKVARAPPHPSGSLFSF